MLVVVGRTFRNGEEVTRPQDLRSSSSPEDPMDRLRCLKENTAKPKSFKVVALVPFSSRYICLELLEYRTEYRRRIPTLTTTYK